MKLQRIQVPDFRVLKNVDISFEKDFVPNIFPLGSQNGGGKSTLLQLIFVLLHCSGDSSRHEFIKNLLHGFEIDDSGKGVLAAIDIWDGDKTVNLEFVAYRDSYAKELLVSSEKASNYNIPIDEQYEYLSFHTPNTLSYIKEEIEDIESKISVLNSILISIESIEHIKKSEEIKPLLRNIEFSLKILKYYQFSEQFKDGINLEILRQFILLEISTYQSKLQIISKKRDIIENYIPKILSYLHSNNLIYICNYSNFKDKNEDKALLCRVQNLNIDETEDFFTKLSNKIFIAAPTTQVFLFLGQQQIQQLFQQTNNYHSQIQIVKSKLSGFFTYEFFAVNLLISIFQKARDNDFKIAIETGEYGNNYQKLVNDLNQILLNKKININPDLSGFTFTLDRSGWGDIELYPEDLSHGELKRLSIYAWIKYNIIEDSIVLIDEIENGFHPDWQYQIIKDIAEWAPKNQYIIATHSYELCQAVTPAHVKELEPRLIKQESES